jgi:hypothetical protein
MGLDPNCKRDGPVAVSIEKRMNLLIALKARNVLTTWATFDNHLLRRQFVFTRVEEGIALFQIVNEVQNKIQTRKRRQILLLYFTPSVVSLLHHSIT